MEHIGKCIEETVAANNDIAHGAAFVPAVAVAAEQNGCAGGVIEEIVLAHGVAKRREQGSAGAIIAHGAVAEQHFGGPSDIFNAVALFFSHFGRDIVVEGDEIFFSASYRAAGGVDAANSSAEGQLIHCG